ncbi:TolC family protein [Azovibrio restrictus]|uniref:TolC family protein n=1 Tax=Azovibrio restrictus TaxID=146938 RepID=UPI0026E986C6|nr:TolC family protein [Azovibrio restrictus]
MAILSRPCPTCYLMTGFMPKLPATPLPLALLCLACVSGGSHGAPDPFSLDTRIPAPRPLDQEPVQAPCLPPASDTALTLAQVVDEALCHHPQTREAWANARVQANLAGVARGAYLPTLNAALGAGRRHQEVAGKRDDQRQETASLNFSYLLYDFGGRAASLDSSQQLLEALLATEDATRQRVFLNALQAYYQVHATEAAVQAARESEQAARESFKAAEARYLAGTATPADRLQAQTAFSQATLARIRAEGSLRNAQGALAHAMGRDAHVPVRLAPIQIDFPEPHFEADLAALVAQAKARRPDLQAAEARYQAARSDVAAARAAGMPSLSLGITPTYQALDGVTSRTGSIGLTLSIPLFTGFADSYRIRAAEARLDASAAQREQLAQQVALDVWQAYQNLLTATHTLRTTADLLASAQASEQVALGRYRAGVGNILDLLNAQSALANARLQRIQSAFDWHISRASLAQAMGQMDKRLLDTGLSALPALSRNTP